MSCEWLLLCRYMKGCKAGAAGAPTAAPKVSAAIEAEFRRLRSQPNGWEIAVNMLAQAGDPATAYSLAHNDWYRLRRALEVLLVRVRSYPHIVNLMTQFPFERSISPTKHPECSTTQIYHLIE